ncbi:MAG: response regulator, partial [Planctomycetes bacterium]|nr:response regulator [Planctomycetota bacterium]
VLDGYGFLCKFREDESNSSSKIVLLTTEGQKEKIVKALDAGADDYITKPFESDALLETIERVMSGDDVL